MLLPGYVPPKAPLQTCGACRLKKGVRMSRARQRGPEFLWQHLGAVDVARPSGRPQTGPIGLGVGSE